MTREEAIDILKAIQALICPNKESVLENNFSEAFDMAIEALQAQTDGDLIRREDAIGVSIDWMKKEFGYLDLNRGERFIDAIEALPSADRPTGEWTDSKGKIMHWGSYSGFCSVCGSWSEYLTRCCGDCGVTMYALDEEDNKTNMVWSDDVGSISSREG